MSDTYYKQKKCCCIILYIWVILFVYSDKTFGQSRIPFVESGFSFFLSGDKSLSLEQYLLYLKTQPEMPVQERHALLIRTAYIASWVGKNSTSVALIKEADSLESEGVTPDSTSTSDRYIIQAINEYVQKHLTNASDLLNSSLQFRGIENNFEKSVLADTYGFLGLLNKDLEDYETAIRYYKEAISLDRELGRSFDMATELIELAGCQIAIDPFDNEIEQKLNEALAIYDTLNYPDLQATVNNEYCVMYQARGDLPKALDYILKTARIKESFQDEDLDVTYNNIGVLYEDMNLTDSSIIYIHKAINTARRLGKNTRGKYFNNLGARFGKLGNQDSALYYFGLAIQQVMPESLVEDQQATFYSIINPQLPRYIANQANVYYETYKSSGELEDLKKSIQSYDVALRQLDTLRFLYSFENKPHAVKENRKYYFLALQSAAMYYEKTGDQADLEIAFLLACRSKALVFDEYLRVNEARGFLDIDPDLINRVDSLKMRKAEALQLAYSDEYGGTSGNDSISKYSTPVFEIDEALSVLNREIKERNPSYYQSIHTMPAYPSKLVRSRLSEKELLLDYTWHKNQLIVMAIGSNDFKMHHTIVPEELRRQLGVYRNFLEGQANQLSYTGFKEQSRFLYQILLEPFESLIEDKDLFIIADDSLALIPFETLLYKDPSESRPDYARLPMLINKNPVSYYHSVQQFIMNTEKPSIRSQGVSAFAPFDVLDYTDGNEVLNVLKGSAEEIKAIKKNLPVRLYYSASASETQFRKAISKPRIIHVATHGLQTDSIPLQNHLLFYPNDKKEDFKFHLFELLGMHVESPLVVLSSCNTGTGTLQPGEGVLSLARAFHFAGTPALVMSQWPVDDAAAVVIMDEFYACLKKGYPLNKSLQLAKLAYLDQAGKARSKPYFWASFQLTGYSGPIIVEGNILVRRIIPIAAGLILLTIIMLTVRTYLRRKTK